MSDELFSRVDGKKTDKVLHETILRNRQADQEMQTEAVKRAMESGLSREQAELVYGNRSEDDDDPAAQA